MQIYIKAKQAGKRRLVLEKQALDLPYLLENASLRTLIEAIVRQQVAAYNARVGSEKVLHFLTDEQIANAARAGKVGFGAVYHEDKADAAQAVKVALEAFVDGLYAVAVDDKPVANLDENLLLQEGATLTFIKLTLLIGL